MVTHLNLDLSSALDLRIVSSSPTLGSMLGMEPTRKEGRKDGRKEGKETNLIALKEPRSTSGPGALSTSNSQILVSIITIPH